jgi:hypothetical protein
METSPAHRESALITWAFLAIVGAFLVFPLANDFGGFIEERPPHGMPPPKPARHFSLKGFKDRSWQKSLEPRAKRASGLWRPLTLVANDIYSRLFGQISAFNNGSVMEGHHRHLIQGAHLPALNHRKAKGMRKMPQRIATLKMLQDQLRARGKNLILMVTPNVTEIYPEVVPDIFLDPTRFTRQHPYQRVKKLLDESGLVYVDTVETLRAAAQSLPVKLFAPSASHWNDVGSCLALKAVNDRLRSVGGPRWRDFSCDNFTIEARPRSKDRDLLDIANVLTRSRFEAPTPYVSIRYTEPAQARPPSALLVGTSYLFAISEHLFDWGLAKDHRLFFYFKQWRAGGERKFFTLRRERLDWEEILSRDIIIINVGMGRPTTMGYGFIEAAAEYLSKQP